MNLKNQLQSPEVIALEASAGAGKTYALVKRYLRLLINGFSDNQQVSLRQILAITFTNKAAIEMKERIIDILKRIIFDAFENPQEKNDIIESFGLPYEELKCRAQIVMEEIIRHYNYFQVKTIDSFINALLLGCAFSLKRSASFHIKDDYKQYLKYCLDLVIEQACLDQKIKNLLDEFLEHYLFVENAAGWFPREDIYKRMISLFELINKYGERLTEYKITGAQVIELRRQLRDVACRLREIAPEKMNAHSRSALNSFIAEELNFTIESAAKCWKHNQVPLNKNAQASAEFIKLWPKAYETAKILAKFDAQAAFGPYVRLFDITMDWLNDTSCRQDIVFMAELNRLARLIFGKNGMPIAEVYYRLSAKFCHYLIDEFQDTSVLQWSNLEVMVEEALSTGGTLFYAGDIKQAIYRFRGGHTALFEQVKNKFDHFNADRQVLSVNWRSQKAIVEFNNLIFSPQNLRRAVLDMKLEKDLGSCEKLILDLEKNFAQSRQEHLPSKNFGFVEIERLSAEDGDDCVREKIIAAIEDLNKRFALNDIAVLVRKNQQVEEVTGWLMARNIAVESEKTLNVLENSLIKEIICFLKFLDSPFDNTQFAGFILGDIFCRASGIVKPEIEAFLLNCRINRNRQNNDLYIDFCRRWPNIWEKLIAPFFANTGLMAVYELIAGFYGYYSIKERFEDRMGFFMKFLDIIKEGEDEYCGISGFLEYLRILAKDKTFVASFSQAAVKVLTTHKAKGLEFRAVIVPYFYIDIVSETGSKDTNSYVQEFNEEIRLLRITKPHCQLNDQLRDVYQQAYSAAVLDELNAVYVTLTRAKEEMRIFISPKNGVSNNKADCLIPREISNIDYRLPVTGVGENETKNRESKQIKNCINITASGFKNWAVYLRDEFDFDSCKHKRDRRKGIISHAILSRLGNLDQLEINEQFEKACRYAAELFTYDPDFQKSCDAVDKLVKSKQAREIFYCPKAAVFCEHELITANGAVKRLDRLIISKDEAIIVDFKTTFNEDNAGQIRQMREYMELVKQVYPKLSIRGCLVNIETCEIVEVVLSA